MTHSVPANWRVISQTNRATPTGKTRSAHAARSKSQSRQCSKTNPAPSTFGVRVAQTSVHVNGVTPEELEVRLQKMLLARKFVESALLISASRHLSARFDTADVARLMLEQAKSPRSLEKAVQLVRDLHLQKNESLVTLLINEMVRAQQFSAAVKLAQEMVPGFEQPAASTATTANRPCWTPSALIQAMIRAKKFRAALKFSKQFGLMNAFPAPQLVAGMLKTRCWEEAISSIMEMQLFKQFPLEALAVEMIKQRQWSQSVKCINKLSDKDDARIRLYEALVRETAHAGDFVASLRYLREFKLDQGDRDTTINLLRNLVDAMLAHGEFYKAIKYAIKFNLAKNPLDDVTTAAGAALSTVLPNLNEGDRTEYLPQYNVESLIRKAIDSGQFHVASTYIKRLRLREKFFVEHSLIEKSQQNQLLEFQDFTRLRLSQFQDPAFQQHLHALLGDQADDEMVEHQPKEVVISETKEIFSCERIVDPLQKNNDEKNKLTEEKGESSVSQSIEADEIKHLETKASAEIPIQSRFGFAQASPLPTRPTTPVSSVELTEDDHDGNKPQIESLTPAKSAPRRLLELSEVNSVQNDEPAGAGGSEFGSSSKAVERSGLSRSSYSVPSSVPLQPCPQQQQQSYSYLHQQQMAPLLTDQYGSGRTGYPMSTMLPQNPTYVPGGNRPPDAMQRGYPRAPPPPPPPSMNEGHAFDVAALAMQFHSDDGNNNLSGVSFGGQCPPMGYPDAQLDGHRQLIFPGISISPSRASPQFVFKPSVPYTSVKTTSRGK
ncbi:hypothetical protein PsorP6_003806 [Peronosclerospora sorghi]|uniref:Uncharacterized protein n=1 Tax=Peronosclerospora sorghi TaxID=230839 RepID=A0ACC0VQG4_9STRA|nr:hypothetical protein PsorP6_003806 [Peronosclerospora sorghi]